MDNIILNELEDIISDSLKQNRMEEPLAEIHFKKGIETNHLHVSNTRPMPNHLKDEADILLQKHINEGIIAPVNHPNFWLSPEFCMTKGSEIS